MAATAFSPRLSRAWSASPSYLWEVPGKPVIVHVALEVLDSLDREVVESFGSLEARGAEIGGLLLGAVQGSSPFEVFIQSHEVVSSEYKRGPLYKPSPRDLERFEAALEQQVGAGMQVVGFFRSHARKGLGLDTEDVAIFNKFFPKQYQVALLAKPFATKLTAGAIFIREGWSLRSESSYKEFHFRTSTVERRGASVACLQGGERVSPAPASNPREVQPSAIGRPTVIPIESRRGVIVAPLRVPGLEAAGPVPSAAEPGAAAHEPVEPHPETSTGWAPPMVIPIEHDALLGGEAPQKRRFGLIWFAVSATLMRIFRAVKPICIAPSVMLLAILRAVKPICINAAGNLAAAVSAARPMWIAGATVAALVVLSGLLFFPGLHRRTRPATTTSKNNSTLSFRVERSAGELFLTWNRDADVIHEATHAVLAIADGERHQSVNLDQAQLRDGAIVYMPSNSDLKFQLAVTGRKPSQIESEFVRVLRVSPWATREPPSAAPPKPVSKRTRAAKAPALWSSKASKGPGAELAKAQNEAAPLADDLAQSSGSTTALDLPDAPTLTVGPQAQAVLFPDNTAALTATLAPQFQLPVTAPADILEPRIGGQASEDQIPSQRSPEYPLAPKRARVQGSVVARALSAVTATLNQRRRCRVLRSCGTQRSPP